MTTVVWRVTQLAVGLAETTASRFGGAPAGIEDSTTREPPSMLCSRSTPPELADAPVVRLILFESVEMIHHGAEVCLLRDLYAKHRT